MLQRLATRFPIARHPYVLRAARTSAVAVAAGLVGLALTGSLPGFHAERAARTPVTAKVTIEDVRASTGGARLRPSMAALPSVAPSMSDAAFYAVVENAVTLAGDGRLADRFKSLSADEIARERKCLAQAIYFEARSEGAMGKLAVAEVVLTRVEDRRYPGTICGVVFQGSHLATGCQFSWTCDGLSDRPAENRAWKRSKALAAYVMLDVQWERITGDATHYHANYVSPYWAPTLEKTTQVGKHIFYRWHTRQLQDS